MEKFFATPAADVDANDVVAVVVVAVAVAVAGVVAAAAFRSTTRPRDHATTRPQHLLSNFNYFSKKLIRHIPSHCAQVKFF